MVEEKEESELQTSYQKKNMCGTCSIAVEVVVELVVYDNMSDYKICMQICGIISFDLPNSTGGMQKKRGKK